MQKFFLFILALSFVSYVSNCQVTKNNWLLSGNASFSSQKNSSAASLQYKQTDIEVASSTGYFIIDRFAIGLRPSFTYGKNNLVANGKPQTIFSIGPFVRYYLLQADRPFNFLAEGSYLFSRLSEASVSKQHTFFVAVGPVVYFNTTVGLEFLFGYSTTKVVGFNGSNNALRLGIGFQFHLEKDE